MECISLLGASVAKERFKHDVLPVMTAMAAAFGPGGLDGDDPTRQFILKAWVRIGKALGGDFVPYLEVVMPPLLAALETPVEAVLTQEQYEVRFINNRKLTTHAPSSKHFCVVRCGAFI